jgi:hypothetical protein
MTEKKTHETTPTAIPTIGNGEKPKSTTRRWEDAKRRKFSDEKIAEIEAKADSTLCEKAAKKIETTPILHILPTHTDAQIEARYMGYVQGVKATASKTVENLQKKAAEPVGKASALRTQALQEFVTKRARQISDIERRMTKARQKLVSLRLRLLSDAEKEAETAVENARKAFKAAVRPIEDGLEVAIRAVANDAGIKIAAASAEFEPLFKATVAKRIEEERKAKEVKAAVEAAKAANDNAEKPLVEVAKSA